MTTSLSPSAAARPAHLRWKHFAVRVNKTPVLLRLGLGGVCLLAALLSLTVAHGAWQHQTAIKTVQFDSTPSIVAAQDIKANLADMHSNVANELLLEPGKAAQAVADYEKRRAALSENLIVAARNITYDDETEQVRKLLDGLGKYEDAIGQARALHAKKDMEGALAAHRQADAAMRNVLLPAADKLTAVNQRELDKGYKMGQSSATWAAVRVLLAAGALLAVLGVVQYFLFRRMRRVFNPALLAASGLVLVFLIWTLTAFHEASVDLKGAKQDAFDSIGVLERARADAYDANGDESRWLLEFRDPTQAKSYEIAFNQKADRVVDNYLDAELKNITFPGEMEAASAAVRTFKEYRKIDGDIRKLETQGQHAEAVALCIGTEKGQSNWAFAQFDQALDKTIQINRRYFSVYLERAKHLLTGLEAVGPLAAALGVAVLTVVGLWPRLKEYTVS
jgi:hypothetical protein